MNLKVEGLGDKREGYARRTQEIEDLQSLLQKMQAGQESQAKQIQSTLENNKTSIEHSANSVY